MGSVYRRVSGYAEVGVSQFTCDRLRANIHSSGSSFPFEPRRSK